MAIMLSSKAISRALTSPPLCAGFYIHYGADLYGRSAIKAFPQNESPHLLKTVKVFQKTLKVNVRRSLVVRAVFEQFTERSIKAVMLSQHEAKALGSVEASATYLGPDATLTNARKALQSLTGRKRRDVTSSQDIAFSTSAKEVFEAAQVDARRQRQNFISPEHILIAALASGDAILNSILGSLRVNIKLAKEAARKKLDRDQEAEGTNQKALAGNVKENSGTKGRSSALENFCKDLVEEARQQRLDPVIGRDKEVIRLTQILARRSKNNPILLGEPGTGKTAVVDGLAISIATGVDCRGQKIPPFLRKKRLLALDVGLLVSGSKERGELEKRITSILEESNASNDVILMIDEIHQIVGAGAVGKTSGFASGGLDLGNLLKPALARGRLQVIGATTLKEHRQYFEKDAALERRFQPIVISEPSALEAVEILRGLQERYERHHNCTYTDEAVVATVAFSKRYIADRFLPDKAIDLLDEAGSSARISAFQARQAAGGCPDLDAGPNLELQQVLDTKAAYIKVLLGCKTEFRRAAASPPALKGSLERPEAVSVLQEGLWEEASLLRQRELDLKQQLSGACYNMPEGAVLPQVGVDDIARIVSSWTGIPVTQMSEQDCVRLLHLGPSLKEQVIGQDAAVESIAHAVQRARSGLGDPKRPVATLIFSGPTGVGKTHLAKSLAKSYYGSEDAMVRLDMSEYMERHSVSRLVGAPPGFQGYGQGGALTEAVRRRPHCLLLLDELEKAHPDVLNLLLQVFEDGRLTDSQGRAVSFKNALIVMTSNVGSKHIAGGSSMGFALDSGEGIQEEEHARVKSLVSQELKAYFRPELLNRVDEVIVFRKLGQANVAAIASLMLDTVSARLLQTHGLCLKLSSSVMGRLLSVGFHQEYGARPLRRAITTLVEDPMADAILSGKLQPGDTAHLNLAPDNSVFVTATPMTVKSEIVTKPKLVVTENIAA